MSSHLYSSFISSPSWIPLSSRHLVISIILLGGGLAGSVHAGGVLDKRGGLRVLLSDLLFEFINMAFVFLDEGKQEVIIDCNGSDGGGVEHPDQEGDFEHVVKGNQ